MGQPHGFPSSDDPRLPGPPESPSEPPDVVAQRLNTRPRKGHNWATPLEVYEDLIKEKT